jgi:formylglycine-generating enzyme required for sulfatase activity
MSCTPDEAKVQPGSGGAGGTAGVPSGGTSSNRGGDDGGKSDAGAVPEECAVVMSGPDSDPAVPFPDCEHAEVVESCEDGWCEIPAGCFVMGSPESEWGHAPNEEIQAAVTLTRPFVIQQTEVTIEQWTALGLPVPAYPAGSDDWCPHEGYPCSEPCLEPSCPVANVSWMEAAAYANLLSEQHDPPLEPCYRLSCAGPTETCYPSETCQGEVGKDFLCSYAEVTADTVYACSGFRLPTSAEWEYAARAGARTAYSSGNNVAYGDELACLLYCNPDPNLERIGWYCHNSGGHAHPVAELEPNAWGLRDMAGNVAEWLFDKSDGLGAQTAVDPVVVGLGHPQRENRGGAYHLWAVASRMANQSSGSWNGRGSSIGFRLVRTRP